MEGERGKTDGRGRKDIAKLESRIAKVEDKGAMATLTQPLPSQGEGKKSMFLLAASRDALLFNWCWCVHPMKAGAADL